MDFVFTMNCENGEIGGLSDAALARCLRQLADAVGAGEYERPSKTDVFIRYSTGEVVGKAEFKED